MIWIFAALLYANCAVATVWLDVYFDAKNGGVKPRYKQPMREDDWYDIIGISVLWPIFVVASIIGLIFKTAVASARKMGSRG